MIPKGRVPAVQFDVVVRGKREPGARQVRGGLLYLNVALTEQVRKRINVQTRRRVPTWGVP